MQCRALNCSIWLIAIDSSFLFCRNVFISMSYFCKSSMDLTFSRTLKKNKRIKITEDCLDNSLLRVNKKKQILNMKVLKRKIPNVCYFYLKEMDTQLFLSPSILSVHWTLVILSEFFVQSSFSISVLALPKSWIKYLITWNFRDMFISRFWWCAYLWHLNFAILRKFYILNQFNFTFLSISIYIL